MKTQKILYKGGEGELIEKKSRFIATTRPVETAGRPMLDVLLGEDIHNMAVVVTRYFGGTLLGTGGLVRAYSKSVQVGLEASEVIEKRSGFLLKMAADYNGIGKIQYILGKKGLPTIASEYGADVTL